MDICIFSYTLLGCFYIYTDVRVTASTKNYDLAFGVWRVVGNLLSIAAVVPCVGIFSLLGIFFILFWIYFGLGGGHFAVR